MHFDIPKFSSSAYHFSHASRVSILIILNLFFCLKLNHYSLFHSARHHQKKLIIMIVTLILKVSPGKVFLQCAQQLHMFTFCIKDLIMVKKKNFLSLVHKNEVEKKTRKTNEISNYWNIRLHKLFYLTLKVVSAIFLLVGF